MADTTDTPTTRIVITVTPEGWTEDPQRELAHMLAKLATMLEAGLYASFYDLPETLFDSNGNPTGAVAVSLAPEDDPRTWLGLLAKLPNLEHAEGSQAADLRVDNGTTRVWLSRAGLGDGEPFAHTVYVEELDEDTDDEVARWVEVGHFDAALVHPRPTSPLADAYELTRQAVILNARHGR